MQATSTAILVALITASGYIVAALIGLWGTRQRRIRAKLQKRTDKLVESVNDLQSRLEDLKEQLSDLNNQLQESLTGPKSLSATLPEDQCGLKIGHIRKFVEVKMDGSSNSTTERKKIKAITQTILHFLHSYSSSIPGAHVSDPELLTELSSPKVKPERIKKTDGECRFFMTVMGGQSPEDEELNYGFAYAISKSFYMTQEELEAANESVKYEYSSYLITVPTEFLELEVQFPPKYSPTCYLGTYVGDTEFINNSELQRLQRSQKEKCLIRLPRGAKIQVRNPLLGFRYAIYWVPIPRQEYEKLKGG